VTYGISDNAMAEKDIEAILGNSSEIQHPPPLSVRSPRIYLSLGLGAAPGKEAEARANHESNPIA
jgi:hypothetical protein